MVGYKQPPKHRQFGQPNGNKPSPKRKGDLNRTTIFKLACEAVARDLKLGKDPDKVKVDLVAKGLKEGLKPNYPFWRDVMKAFGLLEDKGILIPIQINIEEDRKKFT